MLTIEVLSRFKEKWARLRCQPTNVETAILSYDDVDDMAEIIHFAERILILQSQGAKMLPPDIKTKNVDMRRLYMTMHTAAPDLLDEEVV